MSEILTIGSRASFLAKIQTLIVIKELKKKFNKIQINTKFSTTKGDESKSQEPWKNLGYGIFTNTLTSDLKKNKFDCARCRCRANLKYRRHHQVRFLD